MLRALTLLVSALSASAFAPTGWSGRSRAAPVKSGYLELVESGLIDSMPAQKTFLLDDAPSDYLSAMSSGAPAVDPAAPMPDDYMSAMGSAPVEPPAPADGDYLSSMSSAAAALGDELNDYISSMDAVAPPPHDPSMPTTFLLDDVPNDYHLGPPMPHEHMVPMSDEDYHYFSSMDEPPAAATPAGGDYLSSLSSAAPLPPPREEGAPPGRENKLTDEPQNAHAGDGVALKLVHVRTGEVRRIAASDRASFADITAHARALFGDDAGDAAVAAVLRYRDDEGDLVTVASDDELDEALDVARLNGWRSLRFEVDAAPMAPTEHAPVGGAAPAVHYGVKCDASGVTPIVGLRFHLPDANYDLCEAEFAKLPPHERARYIVLPPPMMGMEPPVMDMDKPNEVSADSQAGSEAADPGPVAKNAGDPPVKRNGPKINIVNTPNAFEPETFADFSQTYSIATNPLRSSSTLMPANKQPPHQSVHSGPGGAAGGGQAAGAGDGQETAAYTADNFHKAHSFAGWPTHQKSPFADEHNVGELDVGSEAANAGNARRRVPHSPEVGMTTDAYTADNFHKAHSFGGWPTHGQT